MMAFNIKLVPVGIKQYVLYYYWFSYTWFGFSYYGLLLMMDCVLGYDLTADCTLFI